MRGGNRRCLGFGGVGQSRRALYRREETRRGSRSSKSSRGTRSRHSQLLRLLHVATPLRPSTVISSPSRSSSPPSPPPHRYHPHRSRTKSQDRSGIRRNSPRLLVDHLSRPLFSLLRSNVLSGQSLRGDYPLRCESAWSSNGLIWTLLPFLLSRQLVESIAQYPSSRFARVIPSRRSIIIPTLPSYNLAFPRINTAFSFASFFIA